MQNFLGLLEHEESDFVDQVKKSKAFIQKIIKDKEDLGVMVANHTGKIKKLELERMDYQKRIIEAEREKRHFDDRLENERQSTMAALQRLENQKQEYDKLHQESSQIGQSQFYNLCLESIENQNFPIVNCGKFDPCKVLSEKGLSSLNFPNDITF